jgi:hypothetical protein
MSAFTSKYWDRKRNGEEAIKTSGLSHAIVVYFHFATYRKM